MRKSEGVLTMLQDRGARRLPVNRLYRLLYNPELYLAAYGKIYRNRGALTPGSNPEDTVDGMSLRRIDELIKTLREETYHWHPVRRKYIPKKEGRKRPIGQPDWTDKLLQEVIRMLLSAYYEPQFSEHSHGFRPNRGCHTALNDIEWNFKGVAWCIEGDIKGCFDHAS
jgi:retron-type reverse transcriptase